MRAVHYLFLASVLSGLLAATLAYADPPTAGVSRALLIGINHYKAVPSLQGSINDIETMREILISRWNVPSTNIAMLTDEAATRAGVLAALNRLVASAGPNETVYFHYSGHGSQVQDLNGDESDGLDETIVPQDGRSGDVPDIVDDELDVIFAKLRAKSAVIVLDSCHSGTATRAFDIRARSVPQDTRVDLYRTGVAGTSTRGITPLKKSRFVVMSGAADNEEALDGPVEGRYHGFFTYALSRSFTSAPPNASPRQIFAGVASELGRIQTRFGRTFMPEPQLEAPPQALDAPLFTAAASADALAATDAPRLAWLLVRPAANGSLMLLNGVLLGAARGSTWAIYPPDETRFAPGRALAVATVSGVEGNDARAQQMGTVAIAPDSRAVAILPAAGSTGIAIRIGDVPQALQQRIKELLSRNVPGLQWVGPQQPARFIVDAQGNAARLLSADGLTVVGTFAVDDERSLANVARIASRTTPATELLALDNPSSRLRLSVRVMGAPPPGTRDIRLVAAETEAARLHSRRAGEPRSSQNSLQLSITVSEDAYLTIVDVDTEGTVNVLFPNSYQRADFQPAGAVRGGREVLIPDSLQPGNRAGFYWDYGPPAGMDTVRVFATSDLATANTIRNRVRALQQQAGVGLATRSHSDLSGLRTDLTDLATRGIVTVADESRPQTGAASDWAAASVNVRVDE
jgi:uncharacterized caspase-like protein